MTPIIQRLGLTSKSGRPANNAGCQGRRTFLRQIGLLGLAAASAGLASACGASATPAATQAPSTTGGAVANSPQINIGFIPLTDCASVVMAHELGLYAKHGVNV